MVKLFGRSNEIFTEQESFIRGYNPVSLFVLLIHIVASGYRSCINDAIFNETSFHLRMGTTLQQSFLSETSGALLIPV